MFMLFTAFAAESFGDDWRALILYTSKEDGYKLSDSSDNISDLHKTRNVQGVQFLYSIQFSVAEYRRTSESVIAEFGERAASGIVLNCILSGSTIGDANYRIVDSGSISIEKEICLKRLPH